MSEAPHQQVLVLTGRSGVPDVTVSGVKEALVFTGAEIGAPLRLAGTAVEIAFAGNSPDLALLRALAGHWGVDANAVPATNREKRLLIADMDSTIISVECIDELADFAGVRPQVSRITEAAMRGELDFEAALVERVRLLAGLTEADLAACHAERVRLNPGVRQLVQTMRARGAATALVSGGFTFFTARVAEAAGFESNCANTLLIEDGRLTGEVGRPILGRSAKLEALESEVLRLGISHADVLAVGDGANDLDMVAAAGLGVAYYAKPALAEMAAVRLDWSDLTALLALQGIPESDWTE